jgi:hypothetical protein
LQVLGEENEHLKGKIYKFANNKGSDQRKEIERYVFIKF